MTTPTENDVDAAENVLALRSAAIKCLYAEDDSDEDYEDAVTAYHDARDALKGNTE
jgi:hypothetical protein